MSTTKVVDSMRDVTTVDGTKVSGAVPAAALSNVDLVEGTKGADIASAGTMTIGTDGGYFDITGTTGISTMTVAAGRVFTLQFDGAVTLTHSSTLYLSGAADFTTEANDHMTFISVAANDVRQIGTGLKDGGSPVVAAGGAWNIIGTTTASTSATLDITGLSSTYDTYAIAFTDIIPSEDADLELRLGDSSGIDSGSSDYGYVSPIHSAGVTIFEGKKSAATANSIKVGGTTVGSAAGEGIGGMLFLHQPGDALSYPRLSGNVCFRSHTAVMVGSQVFGIRLAVITVDRVQIYPSGGTIESGRLTVWGLAHA